MEKKSNSTSSRTRSSSICSKIRQALASYPAFRAIRHINKYNNKPESPNHHHNKPITLTSTAHSNNPPSSSSNSSLPTKHIAKNTASVFQSNPALPQHVKVMNTEERGEGTLIPINFDYSTTTPPPPPPPPPSSSSLSISKVTSPQPRKGHHHHQQEQEEGGKKSLDINDTFAEYIQRTKNNFIIRSASNVGRSQGNSATNDIGANNTNAIKMENQKDPFSDFIQRSGKKLRTTSNVAKPGGSFKRG